MPIGGGRIVTKEMFGKTKSFGWWIEEGRRRILVLGVTTRLYAIIKNVYVAVLNWS